LEARLGAALSAGGRGAEAEKPAALVEAATGPVAVALENGANVWPDENAEAVFMAEARERGEPVVAPAVEAIEETDTKNLPPLDELVNRLSPEVRETLDDLFRARFVAVRRVPKTALKG
jgi:hypothetical protein